MSTIPNDEELRKIYQPILDNRDTVAISEWIETNSANTIDEEELNDRFIKNIEKYTSKFEASLKRITNK